MRGQALPSRPQLCAKPWPRARYFARIADERMGPGDQALLVTHQPRWLSDWLHEEAGCHNLRQLVRGHLRGRARVHLAGAVPPAPRAAPLGVVGAGCVLRVRGRRCSGRSLLRL